MLPPAAKSSAARGLPPRPAARRGGADRRRPLLSCRLHFMMGALAYTLAGTDAWRLIAALSQDETAKPTNDHLLLRRLAPFLIAGLKAPLPDLSGEDPIVALADSRVAREAVNKRLAPAVTGSRGTRRVA